MQIHQAAIERLYFSNDRVFDTAAIFELREALS